MVHFTSFVSAAILFAGAVALPADSAINEPAVSAPDGTPITEMVSATASASVNAQSDMTNYGSSGNYESSNYGSSSDSSKSSWSSGSYDSSGAAPPTSMSYGSGSYGSSGAAPPTYGSGSSSWGNSGYNDCVNQCVAQYGSPASMYTPTSTSGEADAGAGGAGSSGSGATHTVIVAPSQGVLRYIPFALNASVGDTVKFMWGANTHTVTKGTELTPCNRSGDPLFFASGTHDKDFVFTQVINDTNPLYFYCATPGHCQKGMFGVINPPSALNSPMSVSGMMQSFVANNSNIAAVAADSNKQCAGTKAAGWGGSINLEKVPEWARPMMIENTLYTRNFLAANQDLMKPDGTVDMSAAGTNPLMIPQDITVALSSNTAASAPVTTPSSTTSSTVSSTPSAAGAINGNGAGSLASPRVLVGAMVVLVTFFAL